MSDSDSARARASDAFELCGAVVGALRHLSGEARLRARDLAFDLSCVEDAAPDADRSDRDERHTVSPAAGYARSALGSSAKKTHAAVASAPRPATIP